MKLGGKGYGRIIWTKEAEFTVERQNIEAIEAVKTVTLTLMQNKRDPVAGGPSLSDSLQEKIDSFAFEKDFFKEVLRNAQHEMNQSNAAHRAV